MDAPSGRPWWQTGVVYQIYPRSFQDSDGNGIGDLAGITSRLDYLSDVLGIDAIWISPFFPSPMDDFGYDISDYVDVDPIFGTLADFDRLTAEAHRRDIRVILDLVPNHTSDQHAWFRESRSSRDSPRRGWYVWADGKPDGSPPNNWVSVFGGSAWQWDEATGQYYLHSFLPSQPDLNWRNPELKAAMFDVMRFWLDRGADGFRIDTAHYIMKDPHLRDNPPAAVRDTSGLYDADYAAIEHIYDKGYEDVHDVFREIRTFLDAYDPGHPRVGIGEIYELDWKKWASFYGERLDELHMPYNFSLILAPWSAGGIRAAVDMTERSVPPGAWPNYVLGNHDRPRLASRVGPEAARLAVMLLLTLRGTPTIYYGEEIGMVDVPIPEGRVQDPLDAIFPGQGRGRDPERTPMQWDAGPNAGFCPPDVDPWLPISSDYRSVNVQAEESDARSMLALTRALLTLRRGEPALQTGEYTPLDGTPEDCFVYMREDSAGRFLIAINFANEDRSVALFAPGTVVISTHMDRNEELDGTVLTLRPEEGVIVRL